VPGGREFGYSGREDLYRRMRYHPPKVKGSAKKGRERMEKKKAEEKEGSVQN